MRVDRSYYQHGFVSPRVALIYQPSTWTYKLLYGPEPASIRMVTVDLNRL